MLTRDDIEAAVTRISARVRRTPAFVDPAGRVLKLEFLQHTGSFKARGAVNRVLAADEAGALPPAGIVAASGGNAGLAFAFAARQLGIPAVVFVPITGSPVKVAKLRTLGAIVKQVGEEYAEAYEAAVTHASESGALYCHAYDQPDVVAGQGTLGLELVAQVGEVDTVILAVGGGGLMAGVAAALAGRARVVAVEPAAAPTLHRALAAGSPVDVSVAGVAADSLGARRVGAIAYEVATRTEVQSVLVEEAAILDARAALWDEYRVAVEPAAATAWAALASGSYQPAAEERVAVVLCGANTDPTDLTG